MLRVNEQWVEFREGMLAGDLATAHKPDADLVIVNGFPVDDRAPLQDGDTCCLIRRGETPSPAEMEHLLVARHTPGVHEKAKTAIVGIMGLGGLGSLVASALARVGVGTLILADFDVVEPSNLNRQQYFIDQIGLPKTRALQENLARMNPYVTIKTVGQVLTEQSIPVVFKGVDVLAECFDRAETKAAALRAVLTAMPGVGYVSASGLAGYGDNNTIRTRKLYPGVYLVGDEQSAAGPGQGLMAPRVGVAAHHQANQILRLILGEK